MEFLIGAVTGSLAALMLTTLIYQKDVGRMYNRYEELSKTLRRINNEHNRQ